MSDEKAKKPWLSKTLWANLLMAIIAFIPWAPLQSWIAGNPDLVLQILAGVNIVLRMLTDSKIQLK